MNVLAIGCHPDDIEVACAGTLAKYVRQGHHVITCHVANGNLGHQVIDPDTLRVMRREEAKRAGALAGIEVLTCDVGDLLVYPDREQRDKVVEVIRYAKPDVIITHSPDDYMPDHTAVSKLVFDASFAASVPHYLNGEAAALTPVYYMDTLAGVNFLPTEYVSSAISAITASVLTRPAWESSVFSPSPRTVIPARISTMGSSLRSVSFCFFSPGFLSVFVAFFSFSFISRLSQS